MVLLNENEGVGTGVVSGKDVEGKSRGGWGWRNSTIILVTRALICCGKLSGRGAGRWDTPARPTTHCTGRKREGACEDGIPWLDKEGEGASICKGPEEENKNSTRSVSLYEGGNGLRLATLNCFPRLFQIHKMLGQAVHLPEGLHMIITLYMSLGRKQTVENHKDCGPHTSWLFSENSLRQALLSHTTTHFIKGIISL